MRISDKVEEKRIKIIDTDISLFIHPPNPTLQPGKAGISRRRPDSFLHDGVCTVRVGRVRYKCQGWMMDVFVQYKTGFTCTLLLYFAG